MAANLLPKCNGCGLQLRRADVFKTVTAPTVPSHIILVYRCNLCGWVDKTVVEVEDWNSIVLTEASFIEGEELLNHFAAWELEFVDDLGDILNYWLNPAIIEDHVKDMLVCCDACRRRVEYGQEDY